MARELSDRGKAFIKNEEGLVLTAYPDANGYSIGYGHFGAKKGDAITRAQADAYFDQDTRKAINAVNRLTPSTTQDQFDALVDFAYNAGTGDVEHPPPVPNGVGLAGSTLRVKHNAGDFDGASNEFLKWTKSGGVHSDQLEARRNRERNLYRGTPGAAFTLSRDKAPAPPVVEVPLADQAPQSGSLAIAGVFAVAALGAALLMRRRG